MCSNASKLSEVIASDWKRANLSKNICISIKGVSQVCVVLMM